MEKEDVLKYSIIVLVFVGLAAIVLLIRPSPTGYAVQEIGENLTESECVDAQGWWYNHSGDYGCYDLSLVSESECGELEAFWWSEECHSEECVSENISIICGDWVCGTKSNNCGEDVSCGDCLAGEICEEGVCNCNPKTCDDYSGQCGSSLDDGCNGTINCNNNCDSGEDCENEVCVCSAENGPTFCARLDKECGEVTAENNCGDSITVDCGSCSSGKECSNGNCVEESSSSDDDSSSSDDDSSSSDNSVTITQGTEEPKGTGEVKLSALESIIITAGTSEEVTLTLENIGSYYLNCDIVGKGNEASWISSIETVNIAKGDEKEIKVEISVPLGTEAKDYPVELKADCRGGKAGAESETIDVTVLAGEGGTITGDVIGEEAEVRPGITGFVVGVGRGKVIAYVVFLLVLAGAVVLVWRRHAQIRGFDDLILKGRTWISTKFHR